MSNTSSPAAPTADGGVRLLIASSNPGKLREYRAMAKNPPPGLSLQLDLLPRFAEIEPFEETAPTFAENAAGKAAYYSRFAEHLVVADDSGLVVPSLGGAPGVYSARYAGPGASDAACVAKLLHELRNAGPAERGARFVCDVVLARQGRVAAVFSDLVEGEITNAPAGSGGFGYDPVFFFPALGKTFAEIPGPQKNHYSHRGKAFRKLLDFLASSPML